MVSGWEQWIAWAGIVLPLSTLAVSAILYVLNERRKFEDQRYARFWDIMRQAGQHDGNLAAKMAAFYELRKFPEYAEVILRLCDGSEPHGSGAEPLRNEIRATAQFMRDMIKAK